MKKDIKKIIISWVIVLLVILSYPLSSSAQNSKIADHSEYVPTKTGFSINTGYTFDPCDNIYFLQAKVFRLYDYDKVWKHKAPENLRFKVEGSLGTAMLDNNDTKIIANTGIFALLYPHKFETDFIKPYLEAGIGVIYTDYRVQGQDYRFNFNPQAGIGIEFKGKEKHNRFISLRMHHISNGGLGSVNRGQNSIVFAFGQYF